MNLYPFLSHHRPHGEHPSSMTFVDDAFAISSSIILLGCTPGHRFTKPSLSTSSPTIATRLDFDTAFRWDVGELVLRTVL